MRSLLAAIMMFTRLPLWRIVNVDKRYFTDVIKYWPLVGFLTGTVTGGVLWLAAQVCTFGGGVYFGDYCPNPVDRGVARGRVGRLF